MKLAHQKNTDAIRAEAARLGFAFVGVAKAEKMEPEARRLEQWLNKGLHGKMGYMENHFELRIDPRKLVEGAKSVVSLLFNYHNPDAVLAADAPKLAQYAYGKDYHEVLKGKLKDLLAFIQDTVGEVNGRCFVDSAPILERDWAQRGGLGWNGKNTLTIHPKAGSWFFLAELVLDLELVYDEPIKDYCGTCTRCIDACPTEAISPSGYLLDASKCISYLTIELRDEIPTTFKQTMDGWMFGCDVCQAVCPWNRFASRHNEPAFEPNAGLSDLSKTDWLELTEAVFSKVFAKSAVKRAKYAGLKRNIDFISQTDDKNNVF